MCGPKAACDHLEKCNCSLAPSGGTRDDKVDEVCLSVPYKTLPNDESKKSILISAIQRDDNLFPYLVILKLCSQQLER